ncbi:unnamed protein product [Eruca vesicaria subsp. sativa]|uniref:Pre-mRNA cleavage factor Im 25 kDa subunit n=1 Tax=Eruca vesicaria subsp. sativa TaxID=29727 RepID=A0ABC8JHW9_ERUVS|nr:unnamed protein product [Eruca vesicaria subsp. sativa]
MGEGARVLVTESSEENVTRRNDDSVVDLYPLSSYYFRSRDAVCVKDEMISERVDLFKHPHVLLLQYINSIFKLPCGRLRPGESGLKRKLASKLSVNENVLVPGLEVGECIGMWWRPNFETLMYPFLPPNVKHPKECTKIFLARLAVHQQFVVPKNFKLLAVPLCQIHENEKTYGPIIASFKVLIQHDGDMMNNPCDPCLH